MTKEYNRIDRRTLSHQALNILKEKILDGQIPPGSRFLVDVLASQLGISRTPVREALSKLVSMGLVAYDGKTYMATSYTAKDVGELFAIRRALEVLAIREATKNLTNHELAQFRLLCERVAHRISDHGENPSLMIELDNALHKLIYKGTNNVRLKEILFDIREKILLIHKWGQATKKIEYMEKATIEQYLEFLKYLELRDEGSSARLMELHLSEGEQFTIECLGFSKGFGPPVPRPSS